ncbi:U4/U6 small nuclear ribonucleoprotein Prp3 [Thrips palmi]|uniref:U4/U6 small nuclear ribonucleoprotein Prp3 n=1 Tax=Thrips palmi TaxID=161013 RepID=A0A6P8ZIK9_THRPL|nr:U4/U6 small nuclear ribonucleoprotein Prp3 [Thrips palmi]
MTAYLSRKDVEEIKPHVDKTVENFLGFHEPTLVTTALNCLSSGYDKQKTTDKLAALLDSRKAEHLTDKIFSLAEGLKAIHRSRNDSRKRHHDEKDDRDSKKVKREKEKVADVETKNSTADISSDSAPKPSPGQLSAIQIKEMMANAQRMIEERKKALNALKGDDKSVKPAVAAVAAPAVKSAPADLEKARKIAQLQAQIQSKLSTGVLPGVLSGISSSLGNNANSLIPTRQPQQEKPVPLILDSEGRTVDSSGKEVQLTHLVPSLKANIRAKKREEFRQQLQEKPVEELSETHFYDPRLGIKPSVRNKRALRFHEPGKFQQLADRMRMKAQLEKLQSEISQIAKKTGISSATKLAQIAPKEQAEDHVPNVEWWDSVILLKRDGYKADESGTIPIKEQGITHLVEHPIQMRAPTDPLKPIYMPVFLTKKERKKLRRQNRREAWKEEQEKIRLGLEAPPEPKLRISNLMRVLGTEAIQDPTKIEAHVKEQMLKRQKAHEEANAARKLSSEERKEKKMRKLKEDTSLGVHVSVYRVNDLMNPAKKYKVETNAKQLFMTGCVVLFKDCNVVVVEGGPKQQSKYRRVMLHRIKWEEDSVKDASGNEVPNKCVLVWEGTVKQRNFGEIKFKVCPTEMLAREHFKRNNVEQYWDLSYSGAVLEATDDS